MLCKHYVRKQKLFQLKRSKDRSKWENFALLKLIDGRMGDKDLQKNLK